MKKKSFSTSNCKALEDYLSFFLQFKTVIKNSDLEMSHGGVGKCFSRYLQTSKIYPHISNLNLADLTV